MYKIHKGVAYFEDYRDALDIVERLGLTLELKDEYGKYNRIIRYDRGWAIQKKVSGDYVTEKDLT